MWPIVAIKTFKHPIRSTGGGDPHSLNAFMITFIPQTLTHTQHNHTRESEPYRTTFTSRWVLRKRPQSGQKFAYALYFFAFTSFRWASYIRAASSSVAHVLQMRFDANLAPHEAPDVLVTPRYIDVFVAARPVRTARPDAPPVPPIPAPVDAPPAPAPLPLPVCC